MTTQQASKTSVLQRNMSDMIVDYLAMFNIEYVFGIPGGHITSLYESLARSERNGGPRAILTRHESGAAFMAAGYARETGKIGACLATTGPGVTNIITGVASAYAEHLPVLVITGQSALPVSGQGSLQESFPYQGHFPDIINTVEMLEQCTCYNTLITHPKHLEKKLAAALTFALQQSVQGPAHLAIPVDILRTPSPEPLLYPNLSQLLTKPSSLIDFFAVNELYKAVDAVLKRGKKIVLYVGNDCEDAGDLIMEFAAKTNSLIITTQRGKSWINPYHPLYRGVYGAFGHLSAKEVLKDESTELILAVGTSLGQWSTGNWDVSLFNPKMIHIHPLPVYFARSPMAQLHVQGKVKTVFQELIKYVGGTTGANTISETSLLPEKVELQSPAQCHNDASPIKPQRLMIELMKRFPDNTRFVLDNGNSFIWAVHYMFLRQTKNFRVLSGQPSTGWAPGGAVGTALGNRSVPVVCVTGDGSFLMYGHEITVAVDEKVPVIFVILNDHSYGMIKFRNRVTGTENLEFSIPPVDFAMLAKSMGAIGYTIRTVKDFDQIDYQAMVQNSLPVIIDVYIDTEEIPPS